MSDKSDRETRIGKRAVREALDLAGSIRSGASADTVTLTSALALTLTLSFYWATRYSSNSIRRYCTCTYRSRSSSSNDGTTRADDLIMSYYHICFWLLYAPILPIPCLL